MKHEILNTVLMAIVNGTRRIAGLIAGLGLCAGFANASLPTSSLNGARLGAACANSANSDVALHCWISNHPLVEEAMLFLNPDGTQKPFLSWTSSQQTQMYGYFDQMVSWYNAGWPVIPQPQIFPTPLGGYGPDWNMQEYLLSNPMAAEVYLGQVAASLAAELTAQFPWSIAGYRESELNLLLNESVDFQVLNPPAVFQSGYYPQSGFLSSPANPPYVATFFRVNQLIGSTAAETVTLLFQWERRLIHFYTQPNSTVSTLTLYSYFWGPFSPPIPASYIVNGTTYTGPDPLTGIPLFEHYTAGCWGTQSFMSSMLKTMNIPVLRGAVSCGHATPIFPTAGIAMTHGDDPYDLLGIVTPYPGYPAPQTSQYLVSATVYDQLFPVGQTPAACDLNVGVQVANIAIQYGSDYLMNDYCKDLASGATEANGQVYFDLHTNYSVQQLQNMGLWQTLAAKQAGTNWCATHPQ